MALVCLSLLVLPWAAFKFVVELDRNLRESQVSATVARAADAAVVVAGAKDWRAARVRPVSKTLLAAKLPNPLLLDGYADDWSAYEMQSREFRYTQNKISVIAEDMNKAATFKVTAAERNGRLYLFLRVNDSDLVYHNPQSFRLATGDSVILRVQHNDAIRRYTFRPESPGELVGLFHGDEHEGERPIKSNSNYRAVFVTTKDGYNIELRIPLPADGQFGLTVIDVDSDDDVARWSGMFDPGEIDDTGQLKTLDDSVNTQLALYAEPGMRVRVFDAQGWLAGDADKRLPDATIRDFSPAAANFFDAVLYRFIAWVLEMNIQAEPLPTLASGKLDVNEFDLLNRLTQQPQFLQDQYGRVFLSVVQRIESGDDLNGYLLLQKPRVALTAFTESAMLRLVKISGLAVLFVATLLVMFASLLSWRVRRLRDLVESTVASDGQFTGHPLKHSHAADEIGDLSRSYQNIVGRLSSYTEYLQSLASKLSHELRTPLSVLTTSLESIDKSVLDDRTLVSIERAESGADRLQKLIRSLSEAASLEQTIGRSEKTPIDLNDWLSVARDVYQNIYPERRFELDSARAGGLRINASAELLHQMVDKLVSNAVDFSAAGSTITLGVVGRRASGRRRADGRRADGRAAAHPSIRRNAAEKCTIVDLLVENTGSILPEKMEHELFEPMVSERSCRDDQPHMGLGLHIVKLIALYHDATYGARNVPSRDVVQFSIGFPVMN